MSDNHENATFGAGCFWQVEVEFRNVDGVKEALVGYMGGELDNPSYEQVCTDRTGHAEVCQVTFDPEEVSYEQLLEIFWGLHDPTQLNRQGPDRGSQYRTAIFSHTPEQERLAIASREREQANHRRPVVTEIVPAGTFWPAEDYHQRYLEKRGLATCKI
jgi:peptide-methionine (S)-S-oxide reductase